MNRDIISRTDHIGSSVKRVKVTSDIFGECMLPPENVSVTVTFEPVTFSMPSVSCRHPTITPSD